MNWEVWKEYLKVLYAIFLQHFKLEIVSGVMTLCIYSRRFQNVSQDRSAPTAPPATCEQGPAQPSTLHHTVGPTASAGSLSLEPPPRIHLASSASLNLTHPMVSLILPHTHPFTLKSPVLHTHSISHPQKTQPSYVRNITFSRQEGSLTQTACTQERLSSNTQDTWGKEGKASPDFCLKPEWAHDGTPLQYSCLENPMDGGAW